MAPIFQEHKENIPNMGRLRISAPKKYLKAAFGKSRSKSVVDDNGGGDEDCTIVTASQTPNELVAEGHSTDAPSPDIALALDVGLNAHEWLEECFCEEGSVLSRAKFDALPKFVMSDFSIKRHLGKGNFSDAFEVVCKDGGVFAMKCLRPDIRSDPDQFDIGAEDLVYETALLASLDHPHVIKLHGRASGRLTEAFVANDGYFIILDKLDGTLRDRMEAWKRTECVREGPGVEQLRVAHSVADAVAYLHSQRIVFRDLKPDNVGFDRGGVKLFDFGFATGLPAADEENPDGLLFDRCGTARYMAPEVGLSLGYGVSADVYSFGILLWEMGALAKPFSSITSSAEFDRTVFVEGGRPEIDGRWSANVIDLITSCWAAASTERPTMLDVKSSLSSAI